MTSSVHFDKARAALASWEERPELRPAVAERFESHVFCLPLKPDAETRNRFVEACKKVGVKALCLGLDYEAKGVVDVLQTSKYYQGDDPSEPVRQMLRDAEALAAEGFEIARLKLEAIATNRGVPTSDEALAAMNAATGFDHYFEYHLKLKGQPITAENDARLKALAAELTEELGARIPFSCNSMPPKNQRFLNARTYGQGFEASRQVAQRVAEAAAERGFETAQVIEEFIVFDTNKDLDRGWVEP